MAHALAAEGVDVAICARDAERVEREAKHIATSHGVKAIGIAADVSKGPDIDRAASRIAGAFDGLDILINNAGTGSSETIMEATDEKWQYYWDLHVMAAVRMSRALVPLMRKRGGGVILSTASICAKQPLGYEPIYNTTKAALVMFSKCLANELIKENIRVNVVSPGLILTPDWRRTAGILTQGHREDRGSVPGRHGPGARAHREVRRRPRNWPTSTVPVLPPVELLRGIELLRRWWHAEDDGVRSSRVAGRPPRKARRRGPARPGERGRRARALALGRRPRGPLGKCSP